ncbi:MAG: PAS domain-containing protein, partial [Candidatus Thermoplasmatota archaeon]|nr:PAS domain-containing protein [Candidatus Thermoplasmatota archaeon]
ELETSNEEMQSINEELQSTNEELETSREELQATNEELSTVNIELQKNVEELSIAKDDANNLLENTNIATMFLDTKLNIQRFTPYIKQVFNIRKVDIDRPLTDITTKIQYKKVHEDAKQVLDTLVRKEIEVTDDQGRQFKVHFSPYRTMDNRIKGIVITFVDVTDIINAKILSEAIVNTLKQPLLILGSDLRVRSANKAFYDTFKVSKKDTEGSVIFELGDRQWDIPSLKTLLEDIIPKNSAFTDYSVEHDFPDIGIHRMKLNGREIQLKGGHEPLILISIDDLSRKKGGTR